jgi:hypothetical protein
MGAFASYLTIAGKQIVGHGEYETYSGDVPEET